MTPGRRSDILDLTDDSLYLDEFEDVNLDILAAQIPGLAPQRLLRVLAEQGGNAFLLNDELVKSICGARTYAKGRKLLSSGAVAGRSFDGNMVKGIVVDGGHSQQPHFTFRADTFDCTCDELGIGACSHIAALMLAWMERWNSFLPEHPTRDELSGLEHSSFGQFLMAIFEVNQFAAALQRLARLQAAPGARAAARLPGAGMERASGTAVYWPSAASIRTTSLPLKQTIESEFNTTQLRELARWLGVKLKGNAKSAYIDQVAAALSARTAGLRESPDALLAGLPDDHAAFVRRALTARDYFLPLPRNLANALWTQLINRDPDKRLADMLDALRRRAILFPTHIYVGYRDVYYQWLPLEASGGNLPLMSWPRGPVIARRQDFRPAGADIPHFLDALDLLLNAVMSTGTEVRARLQPHAKAASTAWLKDWEHDDVEADRLLNSRPGWVPNPQSGIGVPLLPTLLSESVIRLQNQTGLSGPHVEFLFEVAASLQLIEAPDPYAAVRGKSPAGWHAGARASAMEEWFALTDEVKFARAWNAWRERMSFACEVRRAATGHFQITRAIGARDLTPAGLAAEWCSLRRYVARALQGLPGNQWISWPDWRRLLNEFYPDCAWTVFGQDNWWFSAPGKTARLDINRPDEWKRTIGAVIEAMLVDPLRWFGIVETTGAGEQGLEAFRLTALHDWLGLVSGHLESSAQGALPELPAGAAARPRQLEAIAWLDDMQWRLPPAPDRAEFIAFARRIAEPAGTPFTYRLTPLSIEQALASGITLDEAMRQFEAHGAPMPAPAQALFRSIAERFGRVRIYEALTIVQFTDDYALRELSANTSLAQHIIYQISPRAAVVADSAVDALVEEMVARGYTPGVL